MQLNRAACQRPAFTRRRRAGHERREEAEKGATEAQNVVGDRPDSRAWEDSQGTNCTHVALRSLAPRLQRAPALIAEDSVRAGGARARVGRRSESSDDVHVAGTRIGAPSSDTRR